MAAKHWEQNKDATVYVGNIDERFTQELLSELMTQVGPIRQVHMPQDRVSQSHQGYGFVEFDTPASADYASKVLNGIRLYGKPLRVNKASADKQKTTDIGAELFINNLDPMVDEKILYDTFSQFGGILRQPNVVRDENQISKGYGFVSFDSFEASDAARENMHGQYLLNKQITVEYAYKKDGKGERHGDEAERKLAAEGKKHNIVPEQQVLPVAYHMSGAGAAPGAGVQQPVGFANAPPPAGFGSAPQPPGGSEMPTSGGIGMDMSYATGVSVASSHASMGSRGQGAMGMPANAPPVGFGGRSAPGNSPAYGVRGGSHSATGANSLPPPPTGLPARPPIPSSGYPSIPPGFANATPPAGIYGHPSSVSPPGQSGYPHRQ